MQIYLIRHAAAEDAEGGDDAARPLSARGAKSFKRVVDGLRSLDVRFERLLHSPLLRAVQTAELCSPLLAGETEVRPELTQPPSKALIELLGSEGTVALVGHEPYLSQLCVWLCTGWQIHDAPARRGVLELKPGAVAWLEGEPAPGAFALRGLFPPKITKRLGRR